jgi:hypothetical protein
VTEPACLVVVVKRIGTLVPKPGRICMLATMHRREGMPSHWGNP